MSDVVLHWMINEVQEVGKRNEKYALKWSDRRLGSFEKNFETKKETQAYQARAHDTMSVGGGSGLTKVLFWKFMGKVTNVTRTMSNNMLSRDVTLDGEMGNGRGKALER